MESVPVLYILMRNDLNSLNSGKAMAQSNHAGSAFAKHMNDSFLSSEGNSNTESQNLFNIWQTETPQGFGTVLVLGVNNTQMRTAVEIAGYCGFVADIVNDPTYPVLVDPELGEQITNCDNVTPGENNRYITMSVDTCAYVFGSKDDSILKAIVGNFKLHP